MQGWYQNSRRLILAFCCYILLLLVGLNKVRLGAPEEQNRLRFTVLIRHYGIDAAEIERSIGIPLENAVSNIQGISRMRTQASMNQNRLEIDLLPTSDFNEFYLQLREICDRIYQRLPNSVQKPEILYSSAKDQPFYIVAIQDQRGGEGLEELRQLAEYELKPLVKRVSGVGEVQIGGGEPREIHIEVEEDKLSTYRLDPFALQSQLQNSYRLQGTGQIHAEKNDIAVTFDSRFASLEELRNWPLVLRGRSGAADQIRRIPLGQVAKVSHQSRETENLSRVNGRRSIVLYLKYTGTGSLIQTSKQVDDVIAQWLRQANHVSKYRQRVVYDLGRDLREKLQDLLNTTLLSIWIIITFVFLAYRDFLRALVSGIFILLSCLSALSLFGYFGLTLNLQSLSVFNVSIGLVADISIILNIAWQEKIRNKSGSQEHLKSVIQIFPALFSSTATSMIVTAPFILQDKINLQATGKTFSIIISISTLVNVAFLPGFLHMLKNRDIHLFQGVKILKLLGIRSEGGCLRWNVGSKIGSVTGYFTQRIEPIKSFVYSLCLKVLLWRRKALWTIRSASLLLATASILLLFTLPKNNQGMASEKEIFVYFGLPSGFHVDAVDQSIFQFSEQIRAITGVTLVETRAKRDSGTSSIIFDPNLIRRRQLLDWIDDYSAQMPYGFVYATQGRTEQELQAEIAIVGPEHLQNRKLAREVSQYLAVAGSKANNGGSPLLTYSVLNFQKPAPMIQYRLFPDRLQQYQLDSSLVSQQLRWSLYGPVSLKWQSPDTDDSLQREIDVRIMGNRKLGGVSYRDIRRKGLLNRERKYIYFSDIGHFERKDYIKDLYRQNRQRSAYLTIYSPVTDAQRLYDRIDSSLKEFHWPRGYTYFIDPGLMEKIAENKMFLKSFFMAVILIYILLAIFYESLIMPLVVIISIPVSLFFILILLYIMDIGLSDRVFIALIICSGIQVNNVIFVIDHYISFYNKYRGEVRNFLPGCSPCLLGEISVKRKSKHVLLTTFSTIVGQIPLLLSGNLQLSMFAWIITTGLAGSLLNSLFILPVFLNQIRAPLKIT